MVAQYTGALLYVVPVGVAAIVAFVATRRVPGDKPVQPERRVKAAAPQPPAPLQPRPAPLQPMPAAPPGRSGQRPHPTLLHAALSAHLDAVARSARAASAPPSASQAARLVSIRRPTPIPRRPSHLCPRER